MTKKSPDAISMPKIDAEDKDLIKAYRRASKVKLTRKDALEIAIDLGPKDSELSNPDDCSPEIVRGYWILQDLFDGIDEKDPFWNEVVR